MPIKLSHGSLEADQIVDPVSRAARVTLYNTDGTTDAGGRLLTYGASTGGGFLPLQQ